MATFLAVASLGDGQWVVAVFSSQNGDQQTTVNFGCGPLGAGAFVKTPDSTSNTHYEVTEIEERWPILRPFLNPDNRESVTGKSTEELLTNTFKMMISAVSASGAGGVANHTSGSRAASLPADRPSPRHGHDSSPRRATLHTPRRSSLVALLASFPSRLWSSNSAVVSPDFPLACA